MQGCILRTRQGGSHAGIVSVQCMTAETKLKLLRQRMLGMTESVAELRRREMEYMSLVRIQVRSLCYDVLNAVTSMALPWSVTKCHNH